MQSLLKQVRQEKPLIHCLTNPISINGCANIILAAGARPIMAEHPGEAAGITERAGALMLNLGNITDARMEAMPLSLKKAQEKNIPALLDLVGVACSPLRLEFAGRLLAEGKTAVLKGNISEILAMAGLPSHSVGIDAGAEDALTEANLAEVCTAFGKMAKQWDTVVMATGKQDLITDGEQAFLVSNGTEMLSSITGTGCMAGALTATFLSGRRPMEAALLGTVLMGIAGEKAEATACGPGSFQAALLDAVYTTRAGELGERAKIRRLGAAWQVS